MHRNYNWEVDLVNVVIMDLIEVFLIEGSVLITVYYGHQHL